MSNIDEDLEFELADMNGEIKNLQDNQENYANTILKEKEKYILLKMERRGHEKKPFYTPLLTSEELVTQDFLLRINSLKKQKTVNQNKLVKSKHTPLAQTKGRKSIQLSNNNSISVSEIDSLD